MALVLGAVLSYSQAAASAEPAVTKEYQLKAAFVYNFAKFVEWPASRFLAADSPLIIGVIGKEPIRAALEAAVKDRKLNGRDLIVKTVVSPEAAKSVHVLFIAATEDNQLGTLLPALQGVSVLTVGESEKFATGGGMLNFILEGDKVRFDINLSSAEQAGLKISAQLLKLAKTVRKQP